MGVAIGMTVAIVLEAFSFSAQMLGLQAGFAYASTIDPNTDADSGILLVISQLIAGMLFFVAGTRPRDPAPFRPESGTGACRHVQLRTVDRPLILIRLGANLFTVGARLALPVVALLVMVDVALALMGRLNQQLQLLSLAFPAKMLTALLVLSWIAVLVSARDVAIQRTGMDRGAPDVGDMTRHGRSEQDRTTDTAAPRQGPRGRTIPGRQGVRRGSAIHGLSVLAGMGRRRLVCAVPENHARTLPDGLHHGDCGRRSHG